MEAHFILNSLNSNKNKNNKFFKTSLILALLLNLLILTFLIRYSLDPDNKVNFFQAPVSSLENSQNNNLPVYFEMPGADQGDIDITKTLDTKNLDVKNLTVGFESGEEEQAPNSSPSLNKNQNKQQTQEYNNNSEESSPEEQVQENFQENSQNINLETKAIKKNLIKKSDSIFGKQLLEGFRNFMQEQRYYIDDQAQDSSSENSNNYNNSNSNTNSNNNKQIGAQLGRALTSQLKGEVNGMLLIKELALASRLDNSLVQSDRSINRNIPFELTIGENGKVLNVELKESCGVLAVDRHFIKLVYQASPINHYARHYKGAPFKINLTIRFVVPAGANRLFVTFGDQ